MFSYASAKLFHAYFGLISPCVFLHFFSRFRSFFCCSKNQSQSKCVSSSPYRSFSFCGKYPPEFFYCLARYPSFVDYAVKNMNGSSGRQRVSAETIGNYLLPVLTDDELSEFRSTVPCLFKAIKHNSIENMSLAQLRDDLFPILMSGEIDVSEVNI